MTTTEETQLEDTPKYFNEQLNILLIGLLAGFACGFFIRSYDSQEDYSKLKVEEKYTTSFEEKEFSEGSEDEGKWSLIPTEDDGSIENYSQGFEYKKEW